MRMRKKLLNKNTSKEIFNKYGIKIPENYVFSNFNIVIGENGCGKTRFLKSIYEIYKTDSKSNVIYSYFPNLSSSKKVLTERKELPVATLYEWLQDNDVQFNDFFVEIENQDSEYISNLLQYQSLRQKTKGENAFKLLQDTYFKLSGENIKIDKNSDVYIEDKYGRTLKLIDKVEEFSPGELMIFYMSIFISLQKTNKNKRVLILDEPEEHLHPNALLKFINNVKELNYFKYIWIATHSLFVLSSVNFENIVYLNKGEIKSKKSTIYEQICDDLIGKEFENSKQFIGNLSQWQYCEYITECFENPEVIDTVNPNDPQVMQFIEFLNSSGCKKILDFGAGSGRLGLSLKASDSEKCKKIVYEIYDEKPKYEGKDFKVHKDLGLINEKYDCIVMMNVLHEIEPEKWEDIFHRLNSLLLDDGYLLFVETSVLSKGEMPTKTGYLVLDIEELETLFNCKNYLRKIVLKNNKKSICVPISASVLQNINSKTIFESIKKLEDNTLEKIKHFRIDNNDNYRYYAFLTQLYINAKLFNEETICFNNLNLKHNSMKKTIKKLIDEVNIDVFDNKFIKFIISYIRKNRLFDNYIHVNKKIDNFYEKVLSDKKLTKFEISKVWDIIFELDLKLKNNNLIAALLILMYIIDNEEFKCKVDLKKYIKNIEDFINIYRCEIDNIYYISK